MLVEELKEQLIRIPVVAPYAVLELVVTSTQTRSKASLITNHMHVADFNYSAGKLLARTHNKCEFEYLRTARARS